MPFFDSLRALWAISDTLASFANTQAQMLNAQAQMLTKLDQIYQQGKQILMTEQEAAAILNKIDATTTKMGATQKADADLLQKISDEIDALKTTAGVPASVATRLGTLADTLQAISDNGDAQAVILTGIAAKGAPVVPTDPVPTPVPAPVPDPTPAP